MWLAIRGGIDYAAIASGWGWSWRNDCMVSYKFAVFAEVVISESALSQRCYRHVTMLEKGTMEEDGVESERTTGRFTRLA